MDGSVWLLIANANSLRMSAEFVSFSEDESLSGTHMHYDPLKHHRRSTRLSGWDYAHPGWYYVTIVVKDREQHFGHVVHDSVEHSPLGSIADAYWREIPQHHFGTELDEHIVMPNHVHGIVVINEKQDTDANSGDVNGGDVDSRGATGGNIKGRNISCGDVQLNVPTTGAVNPLTLPADDPAQFNGSSISGNDKGFANKRLSPVRGSLSVIIRTFKAAVTTWARRNGYGEFAWQGQFHDHIIRNENELFRIREYILHNAINWSLDEKDLE